MIKWRKYSKTNDEMIVTDIDYLVTNGVRTLVARYSLALFGDGYAWTDIVGYSVKGVTHYVPINLPGEEEA